MVVSKLMQSIFRENKIWLINLLKCGKSMPTLNLKFIEKRVVAEGYKLTKVPDALRIKIDDEKIKSELLEFLNKNNCIWYSEDSSHTGSSDTVMREDIHYSDPGSIWVYLNNIGNEEDESYKESKSLKVIQELQKKHDLNIVIDEKSANREGLRKILEEAKIFIPNDAGLLSAFGFFGIAAGIYMGGLAGGAVIGAGAVVITEELVSQCRRK